MRVGVLSVELFISDANSLKDKRSVMKSLKERIRNNFNVSVSEVDGHDKWQKALFGIATVGPDNKIVNSTMNSVLDFIGRSGEVHIVDSTMEIM